MYKDTGWLRAFVPSISSTVHTNTGVANSLDANRIRFGIFISAGTTINIQNLGFQLSEGTEEKPYEQYGVMPSPDYPSEVRGCGDNINWFDGQLELGSIDDNTGLNWQLNTNYRSKNYIKIKENNDYCFSINNNLNKVVIYCYNKSKEFISRIVSENGRFTTLANTTYIKFRSYDADKDLFASGNIKIEKGSKATPYSQFGQGNITIEKSNKNRFVLPKTGNLNGVSLTVHEDGTFDLVGTATANTSFVIYVNKNELGLLENENYTLSWQDSTNSIFAEVSEFTNSIYKKIFLNSKNKVSTTKFIPDSDVTRLRFTIYVANGTNVNIKNAKVQLEKGITKTEFVKHKGETYTIPVQQTFYEGDTFVKQEGKWYEKHLWGKIILKGTEDRWAFVDGNKRITISSNIIPELSKAQININESGANLTPAYSTNYTITFQDNITKDNNKIAFSKWNNIIFLYLSNAFETIEEFKAYLQKQYNAGTSVYVVFKLAEPTLIPCTQEQNTILDKIEEDGTDKNITYFYSEDEIKPILDITYFKDIETEHNKLQTQIDEIKALLSTTATTALLLDNMQSDLESEV